MKTREKISYELDKLRFTGGIDLNTPNIVIEDIARSFLLKIDCPRLSNILYRYQVIRTFQDIPRDIVNEPFSTNDKIKIARFLNPDRNVIWSSKSLNTAFEKVWGIVTGKISIYDKEFDIEDDQCFGYPTPNIPFRLSPAIVYGLIKRHQIITNSETTFQYLIHSLRVISMKRRHRVEYICNRFHLLSDETLINLACQTQVGKGRIKKSEVNIGTLNRFFEKYNNNKYLASSLLPRSDEEAIVIFAKYYELDITSSISPLEEYFGHRVGNFPIDTVMKDLVKLDSHAYDLRYHFNPTFPITVYNPGSLKLMASKININYTKLTNVTIYNELVLAYMEDNFHRGILPGITDFVTCIDLEDIRTGQFGSSIVSYGSYLNGYRVYLVTELRDLFDNNKDFDNPAGGIFSKKNIIELKRLSGIKSSKIPKEDRKKWQSLLSTIESVEEHLRQCSTYANRMTKIYKMANIDDKPKIKDLLEEIQWLAFNMRGWDGKGDWPIARVPPTNNELAVGRSYQNIKLLYSKVNIMDKLGEKIIRLPLIRYRDGNYSVSVDEKEGYTIHDRLQIVLEDKSIYACIRMTSNWLLASSYYYLTAIGFPPNYDIRVYDHIQ